MSTDEYSFSEISGGYRIGTLDPYTTCRGVPTGYKKASTNKTPVSPSQYNNKNILEIGRCAYGYTSITKVTISAPVQTIQCWAFDRCEKLEEVILPPTISYIVNCAFRCCFALSVIYICKNDEVICESNVFSEVTANIIIKVPKGSLIKSLLNYSIHKTHTSYCAFRNKDCTCHRKTRAFNIVPLLIYTTLIY